MSKFDIIIAITVFALIVWYLIGHLPQMVGGL